MPVPVSAMWYSRCPIPTSKATLPPAPHRRSSMPPVSKAKFASKAKLAQPLAPKAKLAQPPAPKAKCQLKSRYTKCSGLAAATSPPSSEVLIERILEILKDQQAREAANDAEKNQLIKKVLGDR